MANQRMNLLNKNGDIDPEKLETIMNSQQFQTAVHHKKHMSTDTSMESTIQNGDTNYNIFPQIKQQTITNHIEINEAG